MNKNRHLWGELHIAPTLRKDSSMKPGTYRESCLLLRSLRDTQVVPLAAMELHPYWKGEPTGNQALTRGVAYW